MGQDPSLSLLFWCSVFFFFALSLPNAETKLYIVYSLLESWKSILEYRRHQRRVVACRKTFQRNRDLAGHVCVCVVDKSAGKHRSCCCAQGDLHSLFPPRGFPRRPHAHTSSIWQANLVMVKSERERERRHPAQNTTTTSEREMGLE